MFGLDLDPIGWLLSMHQLVVQNQLHRHIENLSWALVLVLTAYGLLRLMYFGRGGELGYLFGRLLLAMAILLSLPLVRGVVTDTWAAAYRWSSSVGGPLGLLEQRQQLEQNIQRLITELPAFTASQAIMEAGGQGLNLTEAQATAFGGLLGGGGTPATNLSAVATTILAVLAPIMYALYAALIFFSGFIVLLGVTLLPLTGALLMLPEGGASWMSAWVRMLSSSIFTVIFLPIAFGLVTYLGVVRPTSELANGVENANIIMEDIVGRLEQERQQRAAQAPGGWQIPGVPFEIPRLDLQNMAERVMAEIQASVQGFFVVVINWLVSIIMMIVGFMIGIFLIFRLETIVRGFMGGVLSGAGATAGKLSMAAWKAGRGLVAGGGGGGGPGGGGRSGGGGPGDDGPKGGRVALAGGGSSAKLSPPGGGSGGTATPSTGGNFVTSSSGTPQTWRTRGGNWRGADGNTAPPSGGGSTTTTPPPGDERKEG